MQTLLKPLLLISVLCLNLFSIDLNSISDSSYSGSRSQSFLPYGVSGSSISNVEILNSDFLKINNDVYIYSLYELIFNLRKLKDSGYYYTGDLSSKATLYYYDSSFKKITIPCTGKSIDVLSACSRVYKLGDKNIFPIEFSYYRKFEIQKVTTCGSDENFNTYTRRCQKCPEGQTWNPQTNSCFRDCTDEKTNKWGWSDGSCTDCSASKTTQDVYRCFCGSLGLGVPPTITDVGIIGKPGYFKGKCADGNQFEYRDPEYKPNPKPDDNKTKPDDNKTKSNPNPGGGSSGGGSSGGGGDNSGGSKDKPNPNPGNEADDDFCKKNPNDPKCKKDDDFCKKNPNDPKCKPGPTPGPGSGDNKDKDGSAKFDKGDFDDSDLEKERSGLYDGIRNHINDNLSKFDGIRDGIDQFVNNVQGKGFDKVQSSIKGKCPIKKQISLPNGKTQDVNVDLCEIVSPASEISYYAFYVGFAVGGFLLFLKLLIFSI